MKRFFSLLSVGLLSFNLSLHAQKAVPGLQPGSMLEDFIGRYETDRQQISHFYDLPWSRTRFDRMEQVFTNWQQNLGRLNFEALDQQARIDYILLRNQLRAELHQDDISKKRLTEMQELLSFRGAIQELERARWKMEAIDSSTSATTVTELAEQVKKLKERVEKGKKAKDKSKEKDDKAKSEKAEEAKFDEATPLKVTPLLARRAAGAVGELRNTLKNWFTFYDGYHPDFSWWV